MNPLSEVQNFLNEFNNINKTNCCIDSIRIDFSKQHKKENLERLGKWKKINKNDKKIMDKLKRRLTANEITSAYQLDNYNIYYYNSNKDKPRYRIATMVIFGLKQYHKPPPSHHMVDKIISILKNISNIDLCLDFDRPPNNTSLCSLRAQRCRNPTTKTLTSTYYINNPNTTMINRIIVYDKALKNKLDYPLWRIEAAIDIPNWKFLALPLKEFYDIAMYLFDDLKI